MFVPKITLANSGSRVTDSRLTHVPSAVTVSGLEAELGPHADLGGTWECSLTEETNVRLVWKKLYQSCRHQNRP